MPFALSAHDSSGLVHLLHVGQKVKDTGIVVYSLCWEKSSVDEVNGSQWACYGRKVAPVEDPVHSTWFLSGTFQEL